MKLHSTMNNEFIYTTGCSMTQWNADCEEIAEETKRINSIGGKMQKSTIIYSTIRLDKPIPVTRKFIHTRWVENGSFIYPHEETVTETIFVALVKIGKGHDGIIRDFQLTEDDGTFVPCKCCPSLYRHLYEKYTGLKKIPDYTGGV